MDKIWDGNPLKSEVIGHGGEDKQMNDHAEPTKLNAIFFQKISDQFNLFVICIT